MNKAHSLLAAAIIDKGLDNVTKSNKPTHNNIKGKNNTNPHNNKNGNSNRFDNNLSVEQNLVNLSKRFNELINKGKDLKPGHKNIKESKLNSGER